MAAADKNEILKVSRDSQNRLVQFVRAASFIRDEGWQLRYRLEEADRRYMREFDYTDAQQKARLAARRGDPTKIQNVQTPLVLEGVETSVGFLTSVFLTEYPMFRMKAGAEASDIALMWDTLIGEDQTYYSWSGEFNQAFRNGEKYNFAPVEIDWCERNRYKPTNGTGTKGVDLTQQIYCGNQIRARDPYNTIYDPRVPIHKVHEEGEFVGYVEVISRIQLKRFLANLGEKRLKNDVEAFNAPNWDVQYYIPYINPMVTVRTRNWLLGSENFDWMRWATNEAQNHIQYKNMYTVITLYARIMPYEFGIQAPRDQTPDIWKLVVVNGVLVFSQPMPNAHDKLPIIIVQPQVDNLGHQTKSQAENLGDFQDLTNAMFNARIASARRRISDRMLYNPLLVDPDHINSPNPSAKIPLRPTAYGRKLEEAVHPIPFEEGDSGAYIQDANIIMELARRSQGQNNVSQGQFQKGNKLQDEFQSVMANASARDRAKAIMWEAYGMTPIKEIAKDNYLQFAPKGKKYNRKEQKVINIDPVKLRDAEMEFEVGDGLLPVQKLARGDVLEHAFQTLMQVPAIGQEYQLGDLFSYLMKLGGVQDLQKFRKPTDVAQYEQALGAWQRMMEVGLKQVGTSLGDGKFLTIDDVKKIVGTMPVAPSQQQQPKPEAGNQNAT